MTTKNSVSVMDPASCVVYVAWLEGNKEICHMRAGNELFEIGYWNQIPSAIAHKLRRGLDSLYPEMPLPLLPHEQGWRDVSLDSCNCLNFAS